MEPIFFIIILIISVVIHEVAHGYSAYALGDPTAKHAGRLTLNPIPHIDIIGSILVPAFLLLTGSSILFGWAKPVPFNPYNLKAGKWGPALVAIAGPASNLIIVLVFGLVIRFSAVLNIASTPFLEISSMIVILNIALAVFNLIPIPPLDGSKILFALIPYKWHQVEEFLTRYQLVLVLFVIFFAIDIIPPVITFIYSLITGIGF